MDENQKPFACSEKGCEMTFTNEDHLNWHQKKHDMMLNLGLANKNNDVADQTPTPTRFIRNCEEVGLFQDLQNVNPFDDLFKKAVDIAKSGGTLEVPETNNSDDTLHTPHILPHIEENRKKLTSTNSRDDNNSHSNDFSLNNVIQINTNSENNNENTNKDKDSQPTPVIVIEDESSDERDVKKRIKEALQNKEKQRQKNEKENHKGVSVVPFQNLAIIRENPRSNLEKEKINSVRSGPVDETREKIREMNRAAQIRCRKRKQIRWKEMEEEINILKEENKKLRFENYNLQFQLMQIKEKTLNAEKEPVQGTIIGTLVPVADKQQKTPEKGTSLLPSETTSSPMVTHTPPKTNITTMPSPIVIQILPGTSNIAVPISSNLQPNGVKIENIPSLPLPNLTRNITENSQKPKLRKKNFRKIIPKIIIEN